MNNETNFRNEVLFRNYTQSSCLSVELIHEFEQDFENQLNELLVNVNNKIYENNKKDNSPNENSTLLQFCNEWRTSYPNLRIMGKQILKSKDEKISPISSIKEKKIENFIPLNKICSHGGYEEEIILSDNNFEEYFAIDLPIKNKQSQKSKDKENDIKKERRFQRKFGFPPISPRMCITEYIFHKLIFNIWEGIVPIILPLFDKYKPLDGKKGEKIFQKKNKGEEINEINLENSTPSFNSYDDSFISDDEDIKFENFEKRKIKTSWMQGSPQIKPVTQNINFGLDNSFRIFAINKKKKNVEILKLSSGETAKKKKKKRNRRGKKDTNNFGKRPKSGNNNYKLSKQNSHFLYNSQKKSEILPRIIKKNSNYNKKSGESLFPIKSLSNVTKINKKIVGRKEKKENTSHRLKFPQLRQRTPNSKQQTGDINDDIGTIFEKYRAKTALPRKFFKKENFSRKGESFKKKKY